MHEESDGRGVAIESINVGDGRSLSLRVLTALIDTSLSNGGLQRWGGGGFFKESSLFPTGTEAPPLLCWLVRGDWWGMEVPGVGGEGGGGWQWNCRHQWHGQSLV
jgi:hypothetical protein